MAKLTLGGRLQSARNAAGLTQRAVALRADVHKATVSRWENDGLEPGVERIAALAAMYRESATWIAFGTGPRLRQLNGKRKRATPATAPRTRPRLPSNTTSRNMQRQ